MPTSTTPAAPSPVRLALYNALPSVLWSALGLGPVGVFSYQHLARPWLWGLLAASLLVYAVPRAWFRHWQLAGSVGPYHRLGVPVLLHLAQHGTLINRLIRRRYPRYRHLPTRRALRGLVAGSYHMERFHAALLVFFGAVSLYALARGYPGWALLLLLTNVGYNLYPVWLQQYLRLRAEAAGAGAVSRKP